MRVHIGRIMVDGPNPVHRPQEIAVHLAHRPLGIRREVEPIAIDQADDEAILVGIVGRVTGKGARIDGRPLATEERRILPVDPFPALEVADMRARGRGLGEPRLHDGPTRLLRRWRDNDPAGAKLAPRARELRAVPLRPSQMPEAEVRVEVLSSIEIPGHRHLQVRNGVATASSWAIGTAPK